MALCSAAQLPPHPDFFDFRASPQTGIEGASAPFLLILKDIPALFVIFGSMPSQLPPKTVSAFPKAPWLTSVSKCIAFSWSDAVYFGICL
jgi:hypothetical protein